MANPEHVEIVKLGAKAIAKWREENPGVEFDLSNSNFVAVDLSFADLMDANLNNADLGVADEIREYLIGDFGKWKDHDAFEAAAGKLIKGLRQSEGKAE